MFGKLNTEMLRSIGSTSESLRSSINSLMGSIELLRRGHANNHDWLLQLQLKVNELESRNGDLERRVLELERLWELEVRDA